MNEDKNFKFDIRASAYDDGIEGRLSKRFYDLLLSQVELNDGVSVLDVGCGTGTILKKLEEHNNIIGSGIDIEKNMIAEAKSKCPNMNIFVSGCTDTPFRDCEFDIITACMAYHHFSDKKGFAKEASRVLKSDGYLYIVDPCFPSFIRMPLNLALRVHKIAGYFGTSKEIVNVFKEFGFKLVGIGVDKYAQCVKLKKVT